VLYNALVAFVACHWIWFMIVTRTSAGVSALGTLMIPVVGVFSSMLVLGERPAAQEYAALVLVLAALATSSSGVRVRSQESGMSSLAPRLQSEQRREAVNAPLTSDSDSCWHVLCFFGYAGAWARANPRTQEERTATMRPGWHCVYRRWADHRIHAGGIDRHLPRRHLPLRRPGRHGALHQRPQDTRYDST
jgi:hypothetical protein